MIKIEIGKQVICIDASGCQFLTKGKKYKVNDTRFIDNIYVTNDKGKSNYYKVRRFELFVDRNKRMKFNKAFELMKKGYKVRRVGWEGYWFFEESTIKITFRYFKNKDYKKMQTINLFDSKDVEFTVGNMKCSDWILVEDEHYLERRKQELYDELSGAGLLCVYHELERLEKEMKL